MLTIFNPGIDAEGEEIVHQFGVLQDHPREAVYNLCGNHDRSAPYEPPAMWWKRWVDPLGENTAESGVDASRRPYPIDGTWERYSFRVGNILFLVMSDVNEPTQEKGRGELGGNPGGVVTGETFRWWKEMVLANPDSIIITAHHYVLKETTVASGLWEGMRRDDRGMWRTHYHVKWSVPKSRVLTFTEGSDEVRVRCYMHTDEFRTQGWYADDEQVLKLSQPFTPSGTSSRSHCGSFVLSFQCVVPPPQNTTPPPATAPACSKDPLISTIFKLRLSRNRYLEDPWPHTCESAGTRTSRG